MKEHKKTFIFDPCLIHPFIYSLFTPQFKKKNRSVPMTISLEQGFRFLLELLEP